MGVLKPVTGGPFHCNGCGQTVPSSEVFENAIVGGLWHVVRHDRGIMQVTRRGPDGQDVTAPERVITADDCGTVREVG